MGVRASAARPGRAGRGGIVTRRAHRNAHPVVRFRKRRKAQSLLLALTALTVTAGCSSSDGGDNAPATPTKPSPSSTLSAEEAQARKDVIAAYQRMTDEQVTAYAKASLRGSKITQYATGKALRDVKDAVFVNLQNGIVFKGEPTVTASDDDVDLNLDGTPQRATLNLCFDMNTWEPVNKTTGKSVAPPKQVKRYTVTAHLQNQGDRWQVADETADKEETC
ncbi:hypothetical protein ACFPH6_32710 [Streptomyces xiangluensis]|uniref:Mce-associated membrane protein n=1 Tax=Streptomyces xiangluensis TaxID=2665720 RepID=A0ABV8YYN4_9ACTN